MQAPRTAASWQRTAVIGLALALAFTGLANPGVLAGSEETTAQDDGLDTWFRAGNVTASGAGAALADPCDPNDPTNGIANSVFGPIPTELTNGTIPFRLENDATLDTDPSFHKLDENGDCVDLGAGGAELGFTGATEAGTIPAGAEYVNVAHYAGAGEFRFYAPPPASEGQLCPSLNENVWFLGIVYDAAQREDFQVDVDNFEYFNEQLQAQYCYPDAHAKILAFENGYTFPDTGKTYEAGSEANLKSELASIRADANQHEDAIVFFFLSSHGNTWPGPLGDGCPLTRTAGSYAALLGGQGEDGFLDDCELGAELNQFDPDVRMGVFVDCSFCGGFSDSLTAVSGTIPDGSATGSSGIPADNRIVVTGCAITTECFGGGPGGGAVLYGHMREVMEDRDCDGWTVRGFPTFQGINAPVNDPDVHPRDGTCSVSEAVFGAVQNAYGSMDLIGIQEQFRIKYGFDTLDEDLAFTS